MRGLRPSLRPRGGRGHALATGDIIRGDAAVITWKSDILLCRATYISGSNPSYPETMGHVALN
jgi:hypothetical protein